MDIFVTLITTLTLLFSTPTQLPAQSECHSSAAQCSTELEAQTEGAIE